VETKLGLVAERSSKLPKISQKGQISSSSLEVWRNLSILLLRETVARRSKLISRATTAVNTKNSYCKNKPRIQTQDIEGNLRPEGFKIGNSGLKWQKPQRLVETVRFLITESNPIKGLRMLAADYR